MEQILSCESYRSQLGFLPPPPSLGCHPWWINLRLIIINTILYSTTHSPSCFLSQAQYQCNSGPGNTTQCQAGTSSVGMGFRRNWKHLNIGNIEILTLWGQDGIPGQVSRITGFSQSSAWSLFPPLSIVPHCCAAPVHCICALFSCITHWVFALSISSYFVHCVILCFEFVMASINLWNVL